MHDYFALSFLAFSQPLRDGSLSPQYPSSPAIHPDKPSQNLHRLGMLARYGPEITSVAYAAVDWQVREECEGEWEERKLDSLRSWGRTVVGSWWERFYLGLPTFLRLPFCVDVDISRALLRGRAGKSGRTHEAHLLEDRLPRQQDIE